MTTTAHTPGPWNVGPENQFREGDIASDKGWLFQRLSTATDADSALVSAAPDLLEALEALQRQALQGNARGDEWMDEALELTRAAIAKAKGV